MKLFACSCAAADGSGVGRLLYCRCHKGRSGDQLTINREGETEVEGGVKERRVSERYE